MMIDMRILFVVERISMDVSVYLDRTEANEEILYLMTDERCGTKVEKKPTK